ncbi:hypothetical protein GCM10019016_105230 [Streptomyces prasinosporus]|uniref:Uncharacterized protein n=1 Tax=Streptomyces prasinosporus TaxID=68256 RepID=A0ABP6U9N6_9ACTN
MDAFGQGACDAPARLVEDGAGGLADFGEAFADPYERAVLGGVRAVIDPVTGIRSAGPVRSSPLCRT